MKLSTSKFSSLLVWIKTHRTRSIIGAAILLIAIVAGVWLILLHQKMPTIDTTPIAVKPKPKPILYYSSLTGEKVASQADISKPVTAVMIENSPDARPQSGLKDAEVVYEAIAEGGITRFLVLYQQNKPSLVGPVRSVRPYYLDWVVPYNASIAHVGGSAVALAEVRNGNYRDIDQFFNANAYYRSTDRYAPHNVYTSFDRLDALNAAKGYTSSTPKPFVRADTKPSTTLNATTLNVHISSSLFDSSYSYDSANDVYTRSQAGAVHTDREKGAITPKVVVVMNVDMSTQFQDTTREIVQTTGSGSVKVFQNGSVIEGTWSRASRDEQFSFSDTTGKPIALARGQTWITAIPNGSGSVSWQ